ncbi:MAG TPA: hypothetical protein V6D10_20010 [Trichocoleus sp.]
MSLSFPILRRFAVLESTAQNLSWFRSDRTLVETLSNKLDIGEAEVIASTASHTTINSTEGVPRIGGFRSQRSQEFLIGKR